MKYGEKSKKWVILVRDVKEKWTRTFQKEKCGLQVTSVTFLSFFRRDGKAKNG